MLSHKARTSIRTISTHKERHMTDRHTTYRESLEHNAYILQLQIDYHLATYQRVQETMTDSIREERQVLIGELHQQLIDIKRKLRAHLATFFPPPPQPTQPTKGEYDMTFYNPPIQEYYNED